MNSILDQLKQKRLQIDELSKKKSRQEGSQDQLLKDLQTKFDLSTVVEAEKKLEELKTELERKNNELVDLDIQMAKIISSAQKKE